MTATPVLNNAADVICGSSLVACDGSLISIVGDGEPPEFWVRNDVPSISVRSDVPEAFSPDVRPEVR